MSSRGVIEILARGVMVCNDHLLLCRNRKVGNVYLPGGHVEFGECGAVALAREIEEEMGCSAEVGHFLGCVEHFFRQGEKNKAEINLLYRMEVDGVKSDTVPPCCEAWIEFFWQPLNQLAGSGLEPALLLDYLPQWLGLPADTRLATTMIREWV